MILIFFKIYNIIIKLTVTMKHNKHFQNLIYVNLTNNRITNLPKEFGTLPFLQRLDLSHNRLGTPGQYKWLWMEQFAIRKNLLYLNISYNLVSKKL